MNTAAPTVLWRIAKDTPKYKATDQSGGGAENTGGRWNSRGVPVLYASQTIALATLETLAHLGGEIHIRNAFLVRLEVPERTWLQREIITADALDPTWCAEPAGATTIGFGDAWLRSAQAPLLMVPSVIVPEEYNVLINPRFPEPMGIAVSVARQYLYDPRLGP